MSLQKHRATSLCPQRACTMDQRLSHRWQCPVLGLSVASRFLALEQRVCYSSGWPAMSVAGWKDMLVFVYHWLCRGVRFPPKTAECLIQKMTQKPRPGGAHP